MSPQCNPTCKYFYNPSPIATYKVVGMESNTKNEFDTNVKSYGNNLHKLISSFVDALNVASNIRVPKIINSTKFIEFTSAMLNLYVQYQKIILSGFHSIVCTCSCNLLVKESPFKPKTSVVQNMHATIINVNAYVYSFKTFE